MHINISTKLDWKMFICRFGNQAYAFNYRLIFLRGNYRCLLHEICTSCGFLMEYNYLMKWIVEEILWILIEFEELLSGKLRFNLENC